MAAFSPATGFSPKHAAIELARKYRAQNPLYIDTETTGIDRDDSIVEIAVVDDGGKTIYQSLVRPKKAIPIGAEKVHHISNEMVKNAPNWAVVWMQLRPLLLGRLVLTYNAEFDLRMLQQTHQVNGLPWRDNLNFQCIMKLYAQFFGEWDTRRGAYRYHSLDSAGKAAGISIPNSHRAAEDTLLARALLHYIADTPI